MLKDEPGDETASKGLRTRRRLRQAAIKVFAGQGFHRTKVSELVAEAGVTQPTFYIYFPSKEALYEELVEEFRERLRRLTARNLIDPATPPEAFIGQVTLSFRRFLDLMAEDRGLTEIGFFQPPGCTVTKERLVGWVAGNILSEQAHGLMRADLPAEHIARSLVGLLDQMGRIEADEAERQQLAGTCALIFCQGAQGRGGNA